MTRKLYILDCDGTLLEHIEDVENLHAYSKLKALPGAKEKTTQWHIEGHMIIITTARCESLRQATVEQLRNAGVFYDMLIMGVGTGERVLVNDTPSKFTWKARAHNVLRNVDGIQEIE